MIEVCGETDEADGPDEVPGEGYVPGVPGVKRSDVAASGLWSVFLVQLAKEGENQHSSERNATASPQPERGWPLPHARLKS